jgi:S-adenosylmethionine hydrolase
VVDPGVGTSREAIVVETDEHFFIGPDNGVFSFIYQREKFRIYKINREFFQEQSSSTFHGRDIFAPAAVRLIAGEPLSGFTEPCEKFVSLRRKDEFFKGEKINLKIIHIDHFGNIILNFIKEDWKAFAFSNNVSLVVKNRVISGLQKTFAVVKKGELLALWESGGFLQIAVNQGNAAELLGVQVRDTVTLVKEN